jgi:hypothetical protein
MEFTIRELDKMIEAGVAEVDSYPVACDTTYRVVKVGNALYRHVDGGWCGNMNEVAVPIEEDGVVFEQMIAEELRTIFHHKNLYVSDFPNLEKLYDKIENQCAKIEFIGD